MTDLERVREWIEDGTLLSPMQGTGFLDFVRQFARNLGLNVGESRELDLPRRSHCILILVDALGMTQLPKMPFLSRFLKTELRAVFPSTTTSALTTLATAELATHSGVAGWWTRLEDGQVVLPLLMVDRSTGQPLPFGVEQVIQKPACWQFLNCDRLTVLPEKLLGTPFSTFASGHSKQLSYQHFDEVPKLILDHVKTCDRTFTYAYLPEVDHESHVLGPHASEVDALVLQVDRMLERLVSSLPPDSALFVTADHGQCDPGKSHWIEEDSPLLNYLLCPPTSEASVPIFHVKPGFSKLFAKAFRDQLGETFALLTHDEAISLGLYGSGSVPFAWRADEAGLRARLGDFIAIAPKPTPLYCASLRPRELSGLHGGLRPDELRIPLCICDAPPRGDA